MLVLLLVMAQDATAMVAKAHALLAPPRCSPMQTTDVTVCGRRSADRYRVPFIVHEPGDPRYRRVSEERAALLHRTTPLEDKSIFLVGGGMVGGGVTVGGGGGTTVRKPAP